MYGSFGFGFIVCFRSSERRIIESEIAEINEWVRKAKAMFAQDRVAKKALMDSDTLKNFIRSGEKMLLDNPMLGDVRSELRKAKLWIAKLQSTGIEKGLAKTQDLQDLIPECESICVDLTEWTESIYATTKSYCLCRQAYFGLMVGCDHCDDWYHAQCIGMSKSAAEKSDKYVCFRCQINQSIKEATRHAGTTINRWMDPREGMSMSMYMSMLD